MRLEKSSAASVESPSERKISRRSLIATGLVGTGALVASRIHAVLQIEEEPQETTPLTIAPSNKLLRELQNMDILDVPFKLKLQNQECTLAFLHDCFTLRINNRDFRLHSILSCDKEWDLATIERLLSGERRVRARNGVVFSADNGWVRIDERELARVVARLLGSEGSAHPVSIDELRYHAKATGTTRAVATFFGLTAESQSICTASFTELRKHPQPIVIA